VEPKPASPADSGPPVPSVLAVVVTHDPGPWLEESLLSLRDQDYERLSVLVVDATSDVDPAERVRSVLPGATIVRQERDLGFGGAANMVLRDDSRASLYLFCHDDVSLEPDAVSRLVDEVLRSNAAIVGPKLVHWDDPTRLQHVGLLVDKFGVGTPVVEERELDQEQHDAVTDVFAVPGACTMVRADLFRSIGGYDEAISFRGDDVDLCWRAQLAGARVMVVPDAVARHRQQLNDRRGIDDVRRLRVRHQLRTMLSCYSAPRLALVLPQALLIALVEVLHALAHGRFRHARDVAGGWWWNLRNLGGIRRRRKAVRRTRQISDAEIRRMQLSGSARLRAYFRGQIGRGDDRVMGLASTGRQLASSLRTASALNTVAVMALLSIVVVAGSRHLLTGAIPSIGDMQQLSGGTGALLADWWRGWDTRAMGSSAPAPTAFGLLGLLGLPLLGHAALLRTVLLLAAVPVGAVGTWRLIRPFAVRRGTIVGTVVYVASPLAYNAYARGSASTLVLVAGAPWVLGVLFRIVGTRPYGVPGRFLGSTAYHALALGILTAVITAAVPFALVLVGLTVVGLVVGSLVAGDARGLTRLLRVSVLAAVVAVVLHVPWSFSFVRGSATWASFAAAGPEARGLSVADLLRFRTGPFGGHVTGYAFAGFAALALVVAQGPRLAWAVRAWFIALGAWGLVWSGEQGWLPFPLPDAGVALAFASAALALAVGLAVAAFEVDLRRHRFGWRQLVPGLAALALVAIIVPFAAAATDGRWKMPQRDFEATFEALQAGVGGSGARFLWIGDPAVLPVAGFDLDGTVAFATSDSVPSLTDRWGGPDTPGVPLVREALHLASTGGTSRLGRMLAPFGIRYLVAVEGLAPRAGESDTRGLRSPLPDPLARALDAQLDLERIAGVSDALALYRNTSWAPSRALLADDVDVTTGADGVEAFARLDITGSTAALEGLSANGVTARGPVPDGGRVYVGATASRDWRLDVDGGRATRADAFGWANVFTVEGGGDATLRYETPLRRRVLIIAQGAAWIAAWLVLGSLRERTVRR
jgi:GT2 family glycosyltransferase